MAAASARSPQAARKLAAEHEESDDELGARRARALRKWAHAVDQAKRRGSAGMSGDAEDSWGRAESHRQALADLNVEVPTRGDLEASPERAATRSGTPAASPAKASSSAGARPAAGAGTTATGARPGGGRAPSRRPRSSNPARTIARVSGASSGASALGGIAGPILVGTLALILLARVVDERQGGPKVVQLVAGGVRKLVDLVVLPVDPFSPSTAAGTVSPAGAATATTGNPHAAGAGVPGVAHR